MRKFWLVFCGWKLYISSILIRYLSNRLSRIVLLWTKFNENKRKNFKNMPLQGHSMVTFVTKIWEFFTFNWSQLLQQTSYQSFRGWCTKYLGWSIHSNPQKINLGQGQAQCPCNARLRLWLRTKAGSPSESLQSPISVKCDRVLCQHLYIWWTTYC